MVEPIKPYASSIRYDGMGSVLATQGTEGPRKRPRHQTVGVMLPSSSPGIVSDLPCRRIRGPHTRQQWANLERHRIRAAAEAVPLIAIIPTATSSRCPDTLSPSKMKGRAAAG